MKNTYKFQLVFALIAILFTSCIEDKESAPYIPGSEGFHLSNTGAFGKPKSTSVTAVSIAGTDTTISQQAFKDINGKDLGGNIEGFATNGQVTVITTAGASQILIVDTKTLKQRFAITEGVHNPRYATFDGNFTYVTTWGEQQEDYSYDNPKVFVINLSNGTVTKVLDLESKTNPEGILAANGKLYVAPSYTSKVNVYDLNNLDAAPVMVEINAAPQHFALDANNNVWVSATSGWTVPADPSERGIVKINDNNKAESLINYPGLGGDGYIKASADGQSIFGLGAEDHPSTKTEVVEFDLSSNKYTSVVSGDGFRGVAQNPATKDIYVSVAPNYVDSGTFNVYSETGSLKYSGEAGVAPFEFIFY